MIKNPCSDCVALYICDTDCADRKQYIKQVAKEPPEEAIWGGKCCPRCGYCLYGMKQCDNCGQRIKEAERQ